MTHEVELRSSGRQRQHRQQHSNYSQ